MPRKPRFSVIVPTESGFKDIHIMVKRDDETPEERAARKARKLEKKRKTDGAEAGITSYGQHMMECG